MKLAVCPNCRIVHEAVGQEALAGLDEERAYEITHCRMCETPSEHFSVLQCRPRLADDEIGYPIAVVPPRARTYTRYWLAEPMLRIGFIKTGVPAQLATELAGDMRVSLKDLAPWIGATPGGITRKSAAALPLPAVVGERLVCLLKLVGQVEIIAARSGRLPGFDAAVWLARWLTTPNDSLGESCPFEFLDTGEGREVLIRLLDQLEAGVFA